MKCLKLLGNYFKLSLKNSILSTFSPKLVVCRSKYKFSKQLGNYLIAYPKSLIFYLLYPKLFPDSKIDKSYNF